jgi:outer membrane protein assembly factor BamB
MKRFESSDDEQERVFDDVVQFEDLDMSTTQHMKRWEPLLQPMFAHRSKRYWLIGSIVISFVCLILVLTPLLPSHPTGSPPTTPDPIHSYLEVATSQLVYEVQNEPGIIRALRRSDGKQIWSYQILPSINASLTLAVNIAPLRLVGNVLYTHIYKGWDITLYALNALTGAILWTYIPPKPFIPFSFSVIIVNGIVYDASIQGQVIALQDQTGKRLWLYRQSEQQTISDMQFHLNGNVIYLSFTQEKQTIALDAVTGVVLWQSNRSLMFIAVSSGISYFSDPQEILYAFDARTGTTLWISPPSFLEKLLYVIASGDLLIYAQPDGSVEAFHVKTARVVWQSKSPGFPASSLFLFDHHLYVVHSDFRQAILASLSLSTGSLLWQYSTSVFPRVEGIGDHIYVKSADQVSVLQAKAGKLLWRSSLDMPIDEVNDASGITVNDPVFQVMNNHLFVAMPSTDGNLLMVLNNTNGHVLWQKNIFGTPLLLMNIAYVTGADGTVYAYSENSGKLLWSTH